MYKQNGFVCSFSKDIFFKPDKCFQCLVSSEIKRKIKKPCVNGFLFLFSTKNILTF